MQVLVSVRITQEGERERERESVPVTDGEMRPLSKQITRQFLVHFAFDFVLFCFVFGVFCLFVCLFFCFCFGFCFFARDTDRRTAGERGGMGETNRQIEG